MGRGLGIAGHAAPALAQGLVAEPVEEGSREGSVSQTSTEKF